MASSISEGSRLGVWLLPAKVAATEAGATFGGGAGAAAVLVTVAELVGPFEALAASRGVMGVFEAVRLEARVGLKGRPWLI